MHEPFTIHYSNGTSNIFYNNKGFHKVLILDFVFFSGIMHCWVKVVEITGDKSEIWVEPND